MTKLRVGQIGVGNFGAHRRMIMRQTGLFELVAAFDHDPEALARCRAEDGARPTGSYEELLQTAGLEAVVISTGAKYHTEQIAHAAERGLHVFVEKPVCATPAEVERLLAVQQRSGVVIGVGHTDHSSQPVSQRIRALIEAGELGTVACFEKTTAHSGGLLIQPGDWRGDPDKNPGGMLFQCGVHAVHELMYYFGPVSRVFATMRYDVHSTGTADVALCHLTFASGLCGTLNAYHVTPYRHTLSLFGTRANLYRNDRYFDEGSSLGIQRAGKPGAQEAIEPLPVDASASDPASGMRSWFHAVRAGGTPYPSLLDGLRAVEVVFAAERAAHAGAPVEVIRPQ